MSRENGILKSLPAGIAPPRDRGRLLFPEDVKEKYFKLAELEAKRGSCGNSGIMPAEAL